MNSESVVLVVIDVQGKLATLMHEAEQLFRTLKSCVLGVTSLEIPTLVVEQLPDKLGMTISEIADNVPGFEPIPKSSFSAAKNTEFLRQLKATGRRDVMLVGIEAHICVYQTAKDLLKKDYRVHLVRDAIGSRDPDNKALAISNLRDVGVNITCLEMALFELMGSADHPALKTIQQLVK